MKDTYGLAINTVSLTSTLTFDFKLDAKKGGKWEKHLKVDDMLQYLG